MKLAAWRLVLMTALFAGWLGYLGYLVATRAHHDGRPLVLSRPQLLVSEVDVLAQVDADDPTKPAKIQEILYQAGKPFLRVGDEIFVDNLSDCHPPPREGEDRTPRRDWTGPGAYLLPLNHSEDKHFRVTPTPASPGFPAPRELAPGGVGPPRIYPVTAAALAQYRQIHKP
jgi:hypothetical protein